MPSDLMTGRRKPATEDTEPKALFTPRNLSLAKADIGVLENYS